MFSALSYGTPLRDIRGNLVLHILNVIERESGSGQSFNLTGCDVEGRKCSVYVTTID